MLKAQGGRTCKLGILHPYNIVNSFRGHTITEIYTKILSNNPTKYDKLGSILVIFIGTNDINSVDFNITVFHDNYLTFLKYFIKLFPSSNIVVISLIARSYNSYCNDRFCFCKYCKVITKIGLDNMNNRIMSANRVIKDIASNFSNLHYLDIYKDFNMDIRKLGRDGLHPSRRGNLFIDSKISNICCSLMSKSHLY